MSGVSFTRSAETNLLELRLHIAEANPVAADEPLDVIQAAVSVLSSQPEMGRARPEWADGLYSFPTRTPYIIFYMPNDEQISVVRVLLHARDIDADYFSQATAIPTLQLPYLSSVVFGF
ncbi:MAG: type II toxin-antitoxin system RelE/ParE family toxin [Gallionella sp.]|jgi:toxin ParE1/3/4